MSIFLAKDEIFYYDEYQIKMTAKPPFIRWQSLFCNFLVDFLTFPGLTEIQVFCHYLLLYSYFEQTRHTARKYSKNDIESYRTSSGGYIPFVMEKALEDQKISQIVHLEAFLQPVLSLRQNWGFLPLTMYIRSIAHKMRSLMIVGSALVVYLDRFCFFCVIFDEY